MIILFCERYHDVSALEAPKLKYRVCMVLDNIPRKNALDNIFWMATYRMLTNP